MVAFEPCVNEIHIVCLASLCHLVHCFLQHYVGLTLSVSAGAFDQHGCPLIMFPVDGQAKLLELSIAEVVDFVNYFQRVHKYVGSYS